MSQEAEDWGGWTGCPHRPSCLSLLDPHTREFPDGLCYETARATCEGFALRPLGRPTDHEGQLALQHRMKGYRGRGTPACPREPLPPAPGGQQAWGRTTSA